MSCAGFFPPYQDGQKTINPSKLNDNFMALINSDNYQEEVDLRTFHCIRWGSLRLSQIGSSCFKVHFHRCCRAPGSASFSNWRGCESTLIYTVLVCVHNHFKKVNTLANFWSWFCWNKELSYRSWSIRTSHINAVATFKRHLLNRSSSNPSFESTREEIIFLKNYIRFSKEDLLCRYC